MRRKAQQRRRYSAFAWVLRRKPGSCERVSFLWHPIGNSHVKCWQQYTLIPTSIPLSSSLKCLRGGKYATPSIPKVWYSRVAIPTQTNLFHLQLCRDTDPRGVNDPEALTLGRVWPKAGRAIETWAGPCGRASDRQGFTRSRETRSAKVNRPGLRPLQGSFTELPLVVWVRPALSEREDIAHQPCSATNPGSGGALLAGICLCRELPTRSRNSRGSWSVRCGFHSKQTTGSSWTPNATDGLLCMQC